MPFAGAGARRAPRPLTRSSSEGEQRAARAGPQLAGGGRGRGGRELASVVIRRLPGGVVGQVGLWRVCEVGASRSGRVRHAVYDCSVAGPAAVRDVVEVAGRGAQPVGVCGAGRGRLRRRPRRRCGRGGGRAGRVLPGSGRWRACVPGRPGSSGPAAACASAAARCSAALRGRSSKRAAAVEAGGGAGRPGATSRATRDGQEDGSDDDERPSGAARGVGGRGGAEQSPTPVPEARRGRAGRAGVVLVVHRAWTARAGPPPARASRGGRPARRCRRRPRQPAAEPSTARDASPARQRGRALPPARFTASAPRRGAAASVP